MLINMPNALNQYVNRMNDPLKAFRFLIEVDGDAVGAFTQFSGIQMEVQTIQARSGNDDRGVQEYIPVLTSFSPVTLTKGVIGSNEFLNWIFSAAASRDTGPTGNRLYRTINVIALDDAGRRGVIWSLKDAMPIRYELSAMDSSRSEVLTESVTFAIQGMERNVSPLSFLLQTMEG
ncbi:MAG: phage tail protein [Ruminococcaceae bacterium]|jgi:phage tail-like protein|nr:phage tail protein [Oscillospiraceae bacterium]